MHVTMFSHYRHYYTKTDIELIIQHLCRSD